MRLLVCGPRNLLPVAMHGLIHTLLPVLREAWPYQPGFVFMHGAEPNGADTLWEEAFTFVVDRNPLLWMPIRRFPAEWKRLPSGKWDTSQGPIRNQRMLEVGQPTYWLAASPTPEPSTPGTSDMVQRLRSAGVPGKVVPFGPECFKVRKPRQKRASSA